MSAHDEFVWLQLILSLLKCNSGDYSKTSFCRCDDVNKSCVWFTTSVLTCPFVNVFWRQFFLNIFPPYSSLIFLLTFSIDIAIFLLYAFQTLWTISFLDLVHFLPMIWELIKALKLQSSYWKLGQGCESFDKVEWDESCEGERKLANKFDELNHARQFWHQEG